jgi:ABC-type multidrug transport system ATPase subunit
MNGKPLGQKFKRVSAYVSQEDVFVPTMSAWETLLFHARLRTDKSLTRPEIESRMEEVLTVMGLQRVKDTVVR